MAYPSPTTTHLIACILFRSASSVLFTLTETDSERKVQLSMQLQEIVTHLPRSPPFTDSFFFLSLSLFLHFCTVLSLSSSGFVVFLSFFLLLNSRTCASSKHKKNGTKYCINVMKDVEEDAVTTDESCKKKEKGEDAVTNNSGLYLKLPLLLACWFAVMHTHTHWHRNRTTHTHTNTHRHL